MRIQDTLSKMQKEVDTSKKVRIYLCGVTVYDESHIGHARTIIIFDVLRRYLEGKGIEIEFIQNFTDIDDKIINRAQTEGKTAQEISTTYTENYFRDFDELHVRRATTYPKATEHISDIVKFIKVLIEKDAAYVTKNGVYFAVSKFPEYGKLSKKDTKELLSGARVQVDEQKKDPLDFAVWKLSDVQPTWPSPWGEGRPGWHIECSAMSIKYLGNSFEIHGGGRDLIFPHHENEIAQSESCTGVEFAKIWMHVGMVTINGEKMSKSVGNVKSIRHVLDNWGPNIIRLLCMSGHYSQPVDYSKDLLKESLTKWRQVETCYYELIHADDRDGVDVTDEIDKVTAKFDDAINDNLDTHLALLAFFLLVKETNRLAAEGQLGKNSAGKLKIEVERMLEVLGLHIPEMTRDEMKRIDTIITNREQARKDRHFEKADEMRDELNEMGVELIDHKDRTIWMRKEQIKAEK